MLERIEIARPTYSARVERGLHPSVRKLPGQRRRRAVRIRDPEKRRGDEGEDRDQRRRRAQAHADLRADLGEERERIHAALTDAAADSRFDSR